MTTCTDKAGSIINASARYEDGKFHMSLAECCVPDLFTIRFVAPTDYTAGDVVVVKGKDLPVRTPGMTAAASEIFKAGAVIHCDIDLDRELAFFWQGNGGGMMLPNLSYEEQFAGFYDVDGGKVYSKTINFGALPNNSTKSVEHGIGNIKNLLDAKFAWGSDGLFYVGGHTKQNYFIPYYTDVNICFETSANMSFRFGRVTLFYTCTDR